MIKSILNYFAEENNSRKDDAERSDMEPEYKGSNFMSISSVSL